MIRQRLPAWWTAVAVTLVCWTWIAVGAEPAAAGPFDLSVLVTNPQDFTAGQLDILQDAIDSAELLWEGIVIGYQPGISLPGIMIGVTGKESGLTGLASASVVGSTEQGGYRLTTAGSIAVHIGIIDEFADYAGTGVNFMDEIVAHEIGHVLGIGTQWLQNGVYTWNSGEYTGPFGVAAYRAEFDATADFVPVELAGSGATANKHWDQIMRSSTQEGDPADPYRLSPLLGITDAQGRDLGLELMTGAIDPDYGEPFLSRTTIQSLRDLGFVVVPEPGTAALLLLGLPTLMAFFRGRSKKGSGTKSRNGPSGASHFWFLTPFSDQP